MANTRFSFVNRIEAAACSLLNGSGGGAPARDEVTGYLMENLETSDRYQLWKNSGGVSMNIDYDLTGGGDVGINVAGLFGHRPTTPTGTGITSCAVQFRTHAAGYVPAGPWGAFGTIALASGRDAGVGGADTQLRYLRLALTVGSAFTLGRAFVGTVEMDLLTRYGPGATRRPNNPRRENISIGDVPVLNWIGDISDGFTMPFLADSTLRDKLDALARKQQTVIYIDHNGVFREVMVRDYSDSERWSGVTTGLFDAQLELAGMP